MRGELYIDGKDAYTDFGVWITEGGYDGLLPFPELVEPDRNCLLYTSPSPRD